MVSINRFRLYNSNNPRLSVAKNNTNVKVQVYVQSTEDKLPENSVTVSYSRLTYNFQFYKNGTAIGNVIKSSSRTLNGEWVTGFSYCGVSASKITNQTQKIGVKVKTTCTKTTSFSSSTVTVSDWSTLSQLRFYAPSSLSSNDFWSGLSSTSTDKIEKYITVDNVHKWVNQLRVWNSWKAQEDRYSYYSTSYNVTQGNDITAIWYNSCANACGVANVIGLSTPGYKPKQATYIRASHFTTLATKVTTWS